MVNDLIDRNIDLIKSIYSTYLLKECPIDEETRQLLSIVKIQEIILIELKQKTNYIDIKNTINTLENINKLLHSIYFKMS